MHCSVQHHTADNGPGHVTTLVWRHWRLVCRRMLEGWLWKVFIQFLIVMVKLVKELIPNHMPSVFVCRCTCFSHYLQCDDVILFDRFAVFCFLQFIVNVSNHSIIHDRCILCFNYPLENRNIGQHTFPEWDLYVFCWWRKCRENSGFCHAQNHQLLIEFVRLILVNKSRHHHADAAKGVSLTFDPLCGYLASVQRFSKLLKLIPLCLTQSTLICLNSGAGFLFTFCLLLEWHEDGVATAACGRVYVSRVQEEEEGLDAIAEGLLDEADQSKIEEEQQTGKGSCGDKHEEGRDVELSRAANMSVRSAKLYNPTLRAELDREVLRTLSSEKELNTMLTHECACEGKSHDSCSLSCAFQKVLHRHGLDHTSGTGANMSMAGRSAKLYSPTLRAELDAEILRFLSSSDRLRRTLKLTQCSCEQKSDTDDSCDMSCALRKVLYRHMINGIWDKASCKHCK